MQPDTSQFAASPDIPPPPPDSRLRYEVTAEGLTVRSEPPPPVAAIVLSILVVFVPVAAWAIAYATSNKAPFTAFLVLVMVAVALTLLAASCLMAFFRRLARPPTWHVTRMGLAAAKTGNLFHKVVRFDRAGIVTVRSSDDCKLQVVTQRAGRWRAHSFPLLTIGGGWLAGLIGTTLGLPPLPREYFMTRTPSEGPSDQITYGFEGAGPRDVVAGTGIAAVAPEGDPPAGASVRICRDRGAWTATRPVSGWLERFAVWTIAATMVVLTIYWVAFKSSGGVGTALVFLIIWCAVGARFLERFARTCGPTIVTCDGDTLHLTRPTGWGTHRQTIHWWMIRSIGLRYAIRRGRPLADVLLHTKAHSTVPLIVSLPERDARWVATLIAGTFAMEEGECTWGTDSPRTMGPR